MSHASYKRNHYIQWVVGYSYIVDGKRKWFKTTTYAKSIDGAFEEVKERIIPARREDFEMRLVGIRFN